MEFVILIVLLVSVVLILNKLTDRTREIHRRFDELNKDIEKIKSTIALLQPEPEARTKKTSAILFQKEAAPSPVLVQAEASTLDIKMPVIAATADANEPLIMQDDATAKIPAEEITANASFVSGPAPPPVTAEPQLSFIQRFLQNNPDLEKFIGENLINKIGIAILVLGIGYFVKFAIDQDWINEIGRVFIGILAGGLLIGVAHRLRNTLAAFSSVLVGGGLAVLYFTIAIAFHDYHLFSQTAAFLIMVVITGFSILLSVSYNRVELAFFAVLGGFSTPFMLSTGQGNYQVLFIYILILNAGMLVLAYLKGWKIINWVAYAFTLILYGGWLYTRVLAVPDAPYTGALIFGTVFYLIFFLMNIINHIKAGTRFAASDITILLSNTFLFYSAGMVILLNMQQTRLQGLFTVAMALFNFAFAYALFRNRKADRNLIYLLIGLVITFVSLAIPVQLEGNFITMFWALEAVLLLWLAQKSGLSLVVLSSVAVLALMLVSLLIDWSDIYIRATPGATLPVLLNKGFITSFMALVSLVATGQLLNKQTDSWSFRYFKLDVAFYRQILNIILVVVLYIALALELHYQLNTYVPLSLNRTIISGTYNLAFVVGLFLWARYKQKPSFTVNILGILAVMAYVILFSPSVMRLLRMRFLEGESSFIGFPFHYLNLGLVLVILYFIYRNLTPLFSLKPVIPKILTWLLCLVVVFIVSSELVFHVIYFNYPSVSEPGIAANNMQKAAYQQFSGLVQQTSKVGFPILWGICAFALMFIGLRKKNKNLRIVALALFSLTLAKLFIYDIRGISEGGKIAAFISLGVLLLVISFMYQNIKRIILADEAPERKD